MTFEDIKAEAKPREAKARLLLNGDMLEEHAALEARLLSARQDEGLGQPADVRQLAQQVVDLEQRIHDEETEFTFRSIGTSAWMRLITEHPPVDKKLDHNPLTFAPAALAASAVDPVMTVDDAQWLMDNAPLSEWQKAWDACLEVNMGTATRPKSLIASALLRLNGTSSTTAPQGESLAASS